MSSVFADLNIGENRTISLLVSYGISLGFAVIPKTQPYLCNAFQRKRLSQYELDSHFSGLVVAAPKHRTGLPVRLVKSI
jgi:hypothetical protein